MDSPYYMTKAYNKQSSNPVLVLFDHILVHGRMLGKNSFNLEAMSYTWVKQSWNHTLFEYEFGRVDILCLDSMVEHGKVGAHMKGIQPTIV